jgi:hypothetical protein
MVRDISAQKDKKNSIGFANNSNTKQIETKKECAQCQGKMAGIGDNV